MTSPPVAGWPGVQAAPASSPCGCTRRHRRRRSIWGYRRSLARCPPGRSPTGWRSPRWRTRCRSEPTWQASSPAVVGDVPVKVTLVHAIDADEEDVINISLSLVMVTLAIVDVAGESRRDDTAFSIISCNSSKVKSISFIFMLHI